MVYGVHKICLGQSRTHKNAYFAHNFTKQKRYQFASGRKCPEEIPQFEQFLLLFIAFNLNTRSRVHYLSVGEHKCTFNCQFVERKLIKYSRSSSSNIMSDSWLRKKTFCLTYTISFMNWTFQVCSDELSQSLSVIFSMFYFISSMSSTPEFSTTYLIFFPVTVSRFLLIFWYKNWPACFGDFFIDWIKLVNLHISIVWACMPLNSSIRYLCEL